MMSEGQRITSLLICLGIAIPISKYGAKIRISVFGERDNIWLLKSDFSSEDIDIQLFRLRNVLSYLKRIQSFPADTQGLIDTLFFKIKKIGMGNNSVLKKKNWFLIILH